MKRPPVIARRRLNVALLLPLALLAAGCATPVPPSAPAAAGEAITGRMVLRLLATPDRPARSVNALFDLQGDATQGQLDLSTPLGTTLARARWQPESVVLFTSDGETRHESLDTLTRDVLGEPVPVAPLFHWLRGRPWPGAASQPLPTTASPGARGFVQLGWSIDLSRYDDGAIAARREQPTPVTLDVRLDR